MKCIFFREDIFSADVTRRLLVKTKSLCLLIEKHEIREDMRADGYAESIWSPYPVFGTYNKYDRYKKCAVDIVHNSRCFRVIVFECEIEVITSTQPLMSDYALVKNQQTS